MVTAAGKVILLGEHAVVYGHAALAGALDVGVTVETQPGNGTVHIPTWGVSFAGRATDATPEIGAIGGAYRALRRALALGDESPIDLVVHFAIPTGAGLGSSAAFAVAVARALCAAHALPFQQVGPAALAAETVVHGRPSGLDHTVAQTSGLGLYSRAAGLKPVRAARPLRLVIGNTGRARDTRGRVARVGALLAERPAAVEGRFLAIAELVARGQKAVEQGDFDALGAAMNENQAHLVALEASCGEIEELCALARAAGALGCKLTGGGGGGCVIALAPGREEAIAAAWERAGYRAFGVTLAGDAHLTSTAGSSRGPFGARV